MAERTGTHHAGARTPARTRSRSGSRSGGGTLLRNPTLTVLIWAVSRVVLLIVLMVTLIQHQGLALQTALSNWDVQHFIAIAEKGYADRVNMAFFPGLPALLRGLHEVGLPYAFAGLLIGLVGSALATWALYEMGGTVAAGLWCIAPATVFTMVGYTEAPFCAAAFWAWHKARQGKWAQAALLAAVACTFRISGLFLIGALVIYALVGNGERGDDLSKNQMQRVHNAFWMVIPLAVIAGYAGYLHHLTGSWTAWYSAQKSEWGRTFQSPVDAFKATWRAAQPSAWPQSPRVATVFALEIVSMAVGVAVTVVCLARRRWAEAGWVGVQVVAFGTSVWFMSVNRAVLLWFPLYLLLGAVHARRPRTELGRQAITSAGLLVVAGCLGAMVWWAWLFFSGQWAS